MREEEEKPTLRVSFQIELKKSQKKVKAFFRIARRVWNNSANGAKETAKAKRLSKRSINQKKKAAVSLSNHSHFLCFDFFCIYEKSCMRLQEATRDKFPMLNWNELRLWKKFLIGLENWLEGRWQKIGANWWLLGRGKKWIGLKCFVVYC